ncbi:MAG: DUF222 domain-containing protein [Actinomycetota bacterium]|nr:DUF222 domain-containing protein [Actinomycetota bacterium]
MFESAGSRLTTTSEVVGWSAALRSLTVTAPVGDGAGLIDQISALEALKSAAAAAQARATVRFAAAQRAAQREAGLPRAAIGRGVAAQVALARRDSPVKGSRHLGVAEALVRELPNTMAALQTGEISEWRATVIVRETACLTRDQRIQVDAELGSRRGGLGALGDRATAMEARRISYRLDPHVVTRRAAKAESERRVSLRPAPDTMSLLTGLLPAKQGIAAYKALCERADSLKAKGDSRSRGQIMSDTLVERVTGQATADQVPVEIHLVMTETSLLGDEHEPADLNGYGPLPAPLIRRWLRGDPDGDAEAQVWVRRLFRSPDTKDLVAMDSARRCFTGQLRRFLIIRDRTCRTPWCEAPIRHVDHSMPHADGGETGASQGQGLCEACNYTKEVPGWASRVHPDGSVETTTPTRHSYISRRPPPVGRPSWRSTRKKARRRSRVRRR